jgi:hypothetical protein
MRIVNETIIISFFLVDISYCQAPDTLWTEVYERAMGEFGYHIEQTEDEGYIVVGKTFDELDPDADIWLLKLEVNGDTAWTKTIGDTLTQEGYCVKQATDGGYVIAGLYGWQALGRDIYVVKTDDSGNV